MQAQLLWRLLAILRFDVFVSFVELRVKKRLISSATQHAEVLRYKQKELDAGEFGNTKDNALNGLILKCFCQSQELHHMSCPQQSQCYNDPM